MSLAARGDLAARLGSHGAARQPRGAVVRPAPRAGHHVARRRADARSRRVRAARHRRAGIEAEPAGPEHPCTRGGHRQVVRRERARDDAAEAGARCILIIVRALEDDAIKALHEAAGIAGLDALYEIHEERELEKALRFNPKIIGVNNRDLKRFQTDLSVSEKLIPQIPDGIVKVSESGIFTPEDASRARECRADAILVGEALMRAEDPEELVEDFHHA